MCLALKTTMFLYMVTYHNMANVQYCNEHSNCPLVDEHKINVTQQQQNSGSRNIRNTHCLTYFIVKIMTHFVLWKTPTAFTCLNYRWQLLSPWGLGSGTVRSLAQVPIRTKYGVWTGRWRGTSSPPGL